MAAVVIKTAHGTLTIEAKGAEVVLTAKAGFLPAYSINVTPEQAACAGLALTDAAAEAGKARAATYEAKYNAKG